MKVLIADDDPTSRWLLEKAVQGFGHQVVSACDGAQAWERFLQDGFHFVITDWVMPGCDGLELCRRIRQAARADYVYIIMVTSSGSPDDLITGMSAGADDFIVKPLNGRELQVRMRAAERILNLQRELRQKNEELETVNARLHCVSRLDALMQIGNRLAFEETLADFHHRALRYGEPFGVVMCDVDHFKAYNDSHGHPAGDEVLREIAAAIRSSLRTSDRAFRYGGEEIALLLPEQSFPETLVLAERLRATVESLQLPRADLGNGAVVTISCGVSACPGDSLPIPDRDTVLAWADQALYTAKALGRNRVEAAEVCLAARS
jgi:diguanylate cyclase (GGDEF)-like protein